VDRDEILRVLRAFAAAGVEYVLIGAAAMGVHAGPRNQLHHKQQLLSNRTSDTRRAFRPRGASAAARDNAWVGGYAGRCGAGG
jgi:hypothetical protein